MRSAKLPKDEQQRLSALYETNLLDTSPESTFDSITNVTASLLNMPMSLICLVDKERVWLKSSKGIEGVSEIHRDIGFCPHTINQTNVFEVKDASLDARFQDSPLVTNEPHLMYYAGAPLITNSGHALGTLCIMDYKARELNDGQKKLLHELASTTTALIEAKRQEYIHQLAKEYHLDAIVEIAPNEIYLVDFNTNKIKYANRTAQLNLGCSLEKLKRSSWNDVVISSPEDLINSYLQTNKSFFSSPIHFQGTQERSDGSTYPVDCHIQTIGSNSNEFLIISDDISERIDAKDREKALQLNLAHISRINTASALSTGLAHELNQPLTAINQYCSTSLAILENEEDIDDLLLDTLRKATSQALRAGEIIKRFTAFTQKRNPIRESINTAELIEETISLVKQDITKQRITVNTHIDKEAACFIADPIQIQQVLLNILTNSIQAMCNMDAGKIDISCQLGDQRSIAFTITDNGPGIDTESIDDITIPNKSTKPKSTGLGLSICKFIINFHDGKLWHDEEFKGGARIHFTLPSITQSHE